jgi:hypothetical protein
MVHCHFAPLSCILQKGKNAIVLILHAVTTSSSTSRHRANMQLTFVVDHRPFAKTVEPVGMNSSFISPLWWNDIPTLGQASTEVPRTTVHGFP